MSELKKLTRLGADTKKIAALLQAKAPKGHVLAYINPREAAILKAHGGSGHSHEDTGIPSFEDGMEGFDMNQPVPSQIDVSQPPTEGQLPSVDMTGFQPGADISSVPAAAPAPIPAAGGGFGGTETQSFLGTGQTATPANLYAGATPQTMTQFEKATAPDTSGDQASALDKLANATGMSKDALGRLGLAGGLGLLGSRQAKAAAASGQKGATEMQALATPYQQAGQTMQAQAQRGELTAAGQQSLQALQAQQAQAAAGRGGVGAAQAAQAAEAFRQQLLQQQYDYGLKLSGIGDNIALGAIKTGLQADQYVNQLTNQFYTNMAYVASGMNPGVRSGGTQ